MEGPLHSQNPTTRFSDRARDYAKFRPSYPAVAIDAVFQGLGPPGELVVADVGAGTGIASRLLADRGASVVAVEPNREMAQAAEDHPRVRSVIAPAEATTLPSNSVDTVVCAQAFHWFRQVEALTEFRRILKPGGRLALVWNIRHGSGAFTVAYTEAIRRAIGKEPAEERALDMTQFPAAGFSLPSLNTYPNEQSMDLDGFLGRARSTSYLPQSGDSAARFQAELQAIHETHRTREGLVTLDYQTRVFLSART